MHENKSDIESSRMSIPRDSNLSNTKENMESSRMSIGVIGLGLMGCSITTAFAVSGCQVIAVAPIPEDLERAPDYLREQLQHAGTLGLLSHPVGDYMDRIRLTMDYSYLRDCSLVLECVVEDRTIKSSVYHKIEEVVAEQTIIATNTSAIPISSLQEYLKIPDRFMGLHWAEPAYATRFLEIICGEKTDIQKAQMVRKWAGDWNKEPTLLLKDIRGFITNRLMYAMYREALTLEEEGLTSLKDMDKAIRYDMGAWVSLMGIFQRMEYIGLEEESAKVNALLPILSNRQDRPAIMDHLILQKHKGVHTGKGLFTYTKEEASQLKKAFSHFNRDMYFLSEKYSNKILHKENK